MTDTKDLTHELQGVVDYLLYNGMPSFAEVCRQAADEIERLQAIVKKVSAAFEPEMDAFLAIDERIAVRDCRVEYCFKEAAEAERKESE
jgi:hypothetical protein